MTLPGRVIEATALVERLHFAYSCTEGTGRLLACLAAATTGPVGESGTGCGWWGKPDGPDAVADLMAPGGIVVMDDFTPCDAWPPTHQGEPDTLRISWLTDSRFASTEVRTEADHAALICTRR